MRPGILSALVNGVLYLWYVLGRGLPYGQGLAVLLYGPGAWHLVTSMIKQFGMGAFLVNLTRDMFVV